MFKPSTGGGDQETPKQRGSGENDSGNSGFYSRIFLVPKKNGNNRSVQTELFSEHSVFQDGNSKQSQAFSPTQGLGVFFGSDRCLTPHAHSLAVSEVSPFLSQGLNISVQIRSIWSGNKFVCIYWHDGCHSNSFANEVYCSVSPFGW